MFLGYPNTGKIDKFKIDDPSPQSIIRNAASGNNNTLVKAVYKDRNLKKLVLVARTAEPGGGGGGVCWGRLF